MNWKVKALGQKAVAAFPEAASYQLYNLLQKQFGKMNAKRVDPTRLLARTSLILAQILKQNQPIIDATFFEVGTGWKLTTPMCLWLCGAKKIITADLNPYLRPDLVELEAEYICQNQDLISKVLAEVVDVDYFNERLALLQAQTDLSHASILNLMNIEYLAPADAANLPNIADIDYHISHTVFEHIPKSTLLSILQEGCRMLRDGGLCVHYIDPSDHFAHRDENITEINFLQFSERQWNFWANNRYAYHNRLRVDDYEYLFNNTGMTVLQKITECDERALAALQKDFQPSAHFTNKSAVTNATTKLLITAQKLQ